MKAKTGNIILKRKEGEIIPFQNLRKLLDDIDKKYKDELFTFCGKWNDYQKKPYELKQIADTDFEITSFSPTISKKNF